jgi:ABC-type uncharacterized transport system involved in gliding motility auxiliary subunit
MLLLEGPIASFWGKDQPAPGEESESPPPGDAPSDETEEEPTGPPRRYDGEGRLLVLTDAELVSDTPVSYARVLRRLGLGDGREYMVGYGFVQNLVEWMSGSEDLLALRSKTQNLRLIDPIKPNEQKFLTWLNIGGIPLLVLFVWAVVFFVRRYQR